MGRYSLSAHFLTIWNSIFVFKSEVHSWVKLKAGKGHGCNLMNQTTHWMSKSSRFMMLMSEPSRLFRAYWIWGFYLEHSRLSHQRNLLAQNVHFIGVDVVILWNVLTFLFTIQCLHCVFVRPSRHLCHTCWTEALLNKKSSQLTSKIKKKYDVVASCHFNFIIIQNSNAINEWVIKNYLNGWGAWIGF